MASVIFNNFKEIVMEGTINLASGGDTIKVALVSSSYTPDVDLHDFFDDITNEVTGTGYSAGGATLAGQDVTQDNTNDRGKFDANDTSWANSTITARGAILYKSTGNAATSPLIAYIDFGSNKSSENGTFQLTWHADGILYLA